MSKVIALAGNPNVGKSTVFNALTGGRQHTGNWAGKTVENAMGKFRMQGEEYVLVDLPGAYSIDACSKEEAAARDFIDCGGADMIVVVCDASCLARNLALVLQIMEKQRKVVVCVNLLDEAEKKGIHVDTELLSQLMGIEVVGAAARSGRGLGQLRRAMCDESKECGRIGVVFPRDIECAIREMKGAFSRTGAIEAVECYRQKRHKGFVRAVSFGRLRTRHKSRRYIAAKAIQRSCRPLGSAPDRISEAYIERAAHLAREVTSCKKKYAHERDRKIDRIITGRRTAVPIMLCMLALVLYITVSLANYPSELLSELLFSLETPLLGLLSGLPAWVGGVLVSGMYRTLAWVVSVMLPPMAIFFPLFTLLEDAGFLPRVAFNMDKLFSGAKACGKQCLTMCMGLGCNACGVSGCRIIDSPRERMVAVITNSFVPCNGRFAPFTVIL